MTMPGKEGLSRENKCKGPGRGGCLLFCRDSTGPCGQTGREEGEDGVEGKSGGKGPPGQAHSHCQDLGVALEAGPQPGSEQRRQAWSDSFPVGSQQLC